MDILDCITKKRDGGALSRREIDEMIRGITEGEVPDYQTAAFLMAVYFRGMTDQETFLLTDAMRRSGDTMDLSDIPGLKVDKHSTGGVGDKATLAAGPLAAALGVPVAKMSGRGLGFSGGTIDKLEAIPGFRTRLGEEEFREQVRRIGIAVTGQTGNLTPADKKIYALRDVAGTVENRSLIASSIMSKKLASGSDAVLLDVKCGSGAFMKDLGEARELARLMVAIGRSAGRKMAALITDMDQPLGLAVGNALEVREAIDTLRGSGPADFTELVLELTGAMAFLGGRAPDAETGRKMAGQALAEGLGLKKLQEMILAQGGDVRVTEDPSLLPEAACALPVRAEEEGFVNRIDAMAVGEVSRDTGAGRRMKDEEIDLSAGVLLRRKRGDRVRKGQELAVLFGSDASRLAELAPSLRGAFSITETAPAPVSMVLDRVW